MPSSYTQNLGIEEPATGEQANVWGDTVNRNMRTLDLAINGNTTMQVATSPVNLIIDNGADSPPAANPVIIWNGGQSSQGLVHIDWQSTRQHLYIMRNQTTGGFGISFAQGTGTPFLLQNGYDAIIYADGGGPGANVAQALANPQFGNVLIQGNFALQGSINGNLNLIGAMGIGNATSIPDALTINGLGAGGMAQLRMVYGNYGAMFRTDSQNFTLLMSALGNPYGGWQTQAFQVDLASGAMGIGAAPSISYSLNTVSLHAGSLAVDGAVSVGGNLSVSGAVSISGGLNVPGGNVTMAGSLSVTAGLNVTSGRSYFSSGDLYQIGLYYGWQGPLTYIGTNSSGSFEVFNSAGSSLLAVDPSGNVITTAGLTVNGLIHTAGTSGGIQFPDGTVQKTATATPPAYAPTPHFPARSTNTVYTNNYGVLLMVGAVINLAAGEGAQAYIGSTPAIAATATNIVAAGNNPGTGVFWASLFFMVPPGWSYQIWYSRGAGYPVNEVTEYY